MNNQQKTNDFSVFLFPLFLNFQIYVGDLDVSINE